jgi:hypothetical protein
LTPCVMGTLSASVTSNPGGIAMAVAVDLSHSLDKSYEGKPLKEILDASPAALAG